MPERLDPETVRTLEAVCERALADALRKQLAGRVPPPTFHLMAKAAVAVLEAVAAAQEE